MLRMLGRLIWVAVGAFGVKAYEEASKHSSNRTRTTAGNGTAAKSRKRRS